MFRRTKSVRKPSAPQELASAAGENVIPFNGPREPEPTAPPPGAAGPRTISRETFEWALERYAIRRDPGGDVPEGIQFAQDGLHFHGAEFDFAISLASRRLNFSLCFHDCRFPHKFDARWARLDSLVFKDCRLFKQFVGSAMEVNGSIDFSRSHSCAQIDLAGASIAGDLILVDARLSYDPAGEPEELIPLARLGAALFCGGLRVHSVLMDKLVCHGRIFLDASKLTGILKAGNAVLTRDNRYWKEQFGKWYDMVFSAADSDIYGAVILGEEAWGVPGEPAVFQADGQVNLSNTRIRGDLVCTNGVFNSAYKGGSEKDFEPFKRETDKQDPILRAALNVSRAQIDGSVWLNREFRACGEVSFDASTVKGSFRCTGATMNGALPLCDLKKESTSERHWEHYALNLDNMEIGSDLVFNWGFTAFGRVSLRNVTIGGDVNCQGGTFHASWHNTLEDPLDDEPERQPEALVLSGAEIRGSVFMTHSAHVGKSSPHDSNPLHKDASCRTFRAYGQVRLRGTRIRRNLHLGGGEFYPMPQVRDPKGRERMKAGLQPLIGWFHSAVVEGSTFLSEPDRVPVKFCGSVSFAGMRTEGWEDSLACWPQTRDEEPCPGATLELNGLTYRALRGPSRGEQRLIWLLHQAPKDLGPLPNGKQERAGQENAKKLVDEGSGFKTQPWEQCAAVLHELGYRNDARFLYRTEQRFLRHKERLKPIGRALNFLLGTFVGHGYRPVFAVLWALWLVILGAVIADWAYGVGYIAPAPGEVIAWHENDIDYDLPDGYPQFRPLLFSLDTTLPAGNLRQTDYWVTLDSKRPVAAPKALMPSPLSQWVNDSVDKSFAQWYGRHDAPWPSAPAARTAGAIAIGALLAVALATYLFLKEIQPSFEEREGFSRRTAKRLYLDRLFDRRSLWGYLASLLSRLSSWFAIFLAACVFFVPLTLYIFDRGAIFDRLCRFDGWFVQAFHFSFAHFWFTLETLLGWLLVTVVAVSLGSTIFHYRRDRL